MFSIISLMKTMNQYIPNQWPIPLLSPIILEQPTFWSQEPTLSQRKSDLLDPLDPFVELGLKGLPLIQVVSLCELRCLLF